jgi:hypothetical protein
VYCLPNITQIKRSVWGTSGTYGGKGNGSRILMGQPGPFGISDVDEKIMLKIYLKEIEYS